MFGFEVPARLYRSASMKLKEEEWEKLSHEESEEIIMQEKKYLWFLKFDALNQDKCGQKKTIGTLSRPR